MENGFLLVEQAAEKWGISKRRVQKLCADCRVPSAQRFGRSWAIPIEVPKPEDGHTCKKLPRTRFSHDYYLIGGV